MYVLMALICVLDSTPRGHHCSTKIFETRFDTVAECRMEKNRLIFHELPSRQEKMVMGDCIYQPNRHVF